MFETVKKIDDVKKFDSHIRMGIKKSTNPHLRSIKRRWGQCYHSPLFGVMGNLI